MDNNIKAVVNTLIEELKKDIWFFGGCGFIVGLFTVWQSRLTELGFVKNPKWANELFSDFVSFNAFGLIFFGYLLIACASTFFKGLGFSCSKLEQTVHHMESRLTQIASAILCFMFGLFILVALYSGLNLNYGGLPLIFLSTLFSLFIVSSFVIALSVGRENEPFNKWWVAIISIGVLATTLFWLLLQGGK